MPKRCRQKTFLIGLSIIVVIIVVGLTLPAFGSSANQNPQTTVNSTTDLTNEDPMDVTETVDTISVINSAEVSTEAGEPGNATLFNYTSANSEIFSLADTDKVILLEGYAA